ncbi:hypothetical protein Q4567_00095 [Aliiglaciecola sp. 2_MG-2023]|uniref:hypothetical protein n=1 Tax=unclassified Aliiglaciecola TaxID=2593648 RepID=UPI0026E1C038|nr:MULTISPECIES: hypothetical protein [unclassified Aliiglaciecola]MDO6709107.1 hypothetical protein [Aliiglaciecola sp. 2_MG-2023]MDO6750255.1 hypothetical protein [Aliiglaciecola sp. 1_MG-2023]
MNCTVVVGGISNIDWKDKIINTVVEEAIYTLPNNIALKNINLVEVVESKKSTNKGSESKVNLVFSERLLDNLSFTEQLKVDDKVLLIYSPPEYALARAAKQSGTIDSQQITRLLNKWAADTKTIWNAYLSNPESVHVTSLDTIDTSPTKFWSELLGEYSDNLIVCEKGASDSVTIDNHIDELAVQLLRLEYFEDARVSSEINNLLEDLDMISVLANVEAESNASIGNIPNLCIDSLKSLASAVTDMKDAFDKVENRNITLENQIKENEHLKVELSDALEANCELQTAFGNQKLDLEKQKSEEIQKLESELNEAKKTNQQSLDKLQLECEKQKEIVSTLTQENSKLGQGVKESKQQLDELDAECKLLTLQVGQLEEELESAEVTSASEAKLRSENMELKKTNERLNLEIDELKNVVKDNLVVNDDNKLLTLQVGQLQEELEEVYAKLSEVTEKAEFRLGKISGLEKLIKTEKTQIESLDKMVSEQKLQLINLEKTDKSQKYQFVDMEKEINDLKLQLVDLQKANSVKQNKIEELQRMLVDSNTASNDSELMAEIQLLQERLERVYLERNVMSIPLLHGDTYKTHKM